MSHDPAEFALALDGVERTFVQGGARLTVLADVNLALRPGEIVGLLGPSGSGKSTLLHIAGLLEQPDGGEVYVGGKPCRGLADKERTAMRRAALGFVYQFHHLLPEFTALENVMLPQMIAGRTKAAARKDAGDLLRALGLGQRLHHRPARLSGGEQQRVAIARAVANRPMVLLADEPTGNLDHRTADAVFATFTELARQWSVAALIATHNVELAQRMDRVLTLVDGRVVQA